ncbi:MAG: S8 family serine peptidase [Bacteriovoracaceae bacterium]|jgi:cell wall-associated protease|nr:S8 family serine peptidase [Bacteriovoracaceae bacterium]
MSMHKLKGVILLTVFSTVSARSATIAVIDSGLDVKHTQLVSKLWSNGSESSNSKDDDGNGLVDDLNGWNFAENSSSLLRRELIGQFGEETVHKYMDLRAKEVDGLLTRSDSSFLSQARASYRLMGLVNNYGQFAHGTHVAGIALKDNKKSKVMGIKLLKSSFSQTLSSSLTMALNESDDITISSVLVSNILSQSKSMIEVGKYLNSKKVEVANGSFGLSIFQASKLVQASFVNMLGRYPSQEELVEYSFKFMYTMLDEHKKMVESSPDTLFVFAAGNDGQNNDVFPVAPANIQQANVISVAATYGDTKLADFSNFGKKFVDVAAPGVNIASTVPGYNGVKMSGTSQAAPLVSNLALRIKEVNKALGPAEIKKIIMETVDKKSWLAEKVKSGGLINTKRAVFAAHFAKYRNLEDGILYAKHYVVSGMTGTSGLDIPNGVMLPTIEAASNPFFNTGNFEEGVNPETIFDANNIKDILGGNFSRLKL